MTDNKKVFIQSFFPDKIEDIHYAQINLDASDLSVADVLRNVNKTFPQNTRNRNMIIDGQKAVAILCKTELLDPLSGLLLLITSDDVDINIVSKNYIVIGVSEAKITNDEDICDVIKKLTKYLTINFKGCLASFNDFYAKYIYDLSEQEASFNCDTMNTETYLHQMVKS